MSEFWIFFNLGLKHLLDFKSYDHLLFLLILTIPFTFKDWKHLLLQVTIFTIVHSLGLLLIVANVVSIEQKSVLAMIPITLLVMAVFNFYKAGKSEKKGNYWISFMVFYYSIIHGLGFLNEYHTLIQGNSSSRMLALFLFTVGIELGQIIMILIFLILIFLSEKLLKFSKREIMLIGSAFAIGFVLPIILNDKIWLIWKT